MRKYLTMVVLLLMSMAVYAQQHSVKGTVVDGPERTADHRHDRHGGRYPERYHHRH